MLLNKEKKSFFKKKYFISHFSFYIGVENNNYIDKSNLVRDDTIYIVSKIVNKEVHLEAEDVITVGIIKAKLMIMKASEINDIWYEECIITISIVSRSIYKYVGCDYSHQKSYHKSIMNQQLLLLMNASQLMRLMMNSRSMH